MRKNKKLILALAATLAALSLVAAATFAWFTSNQYVRNHLETNLLTDGTVTIVEDFTPPTNWTPGTPVVKGVQVQNTGDTAVFVRVSFEEILQKLKGLASTPDTIEEVLLGAPWTIADSNYVPKYIDIQKYDGNATNAGTTPTPVTTGWTEVVADDIADGTIPNGVKVFYKTTESSDGAKSIEYMAYYDIDGIKGQFVSLTGQSYNFDDAEFDFSAAEFKYSAYEKADIEQASWVIQRENLPLTQLDWNATDTPGGPQASINSMSPQSMVAGAITLELSDMVSFAPTAQAAYDSQINTDGIWWFNPDDGWFYLLGVLGSEDITPKLLENLMLAGNADDTYKWMNYDLIVQMQAIHAIDQALTDAAGWALNNSASNVATVGLVNLLMSLPNVIVTTP